MVSLLTRTTSTYSTINVQIVIKSDHSEVGPRTLHGSTILPLGCHSFCRAIFSRPSHSSPEVWQQVKTPNGAFPGVYSTFSTGNDQGPRSCLALRNDSLVHITRLWHRWKFIQDVTDVALNGILSHCIKPDSYHLISG